MAEPIELIAQAKTLDEVVAATGQYLARWSAESLALIPRRCRPHWIGSAEDIEMYAGQLQTECARREASGTPTSNELELMRDFFAGAASSIAAIVSGSAAATSASASISTGANSVSAITSANLAISRIPSVHLDSGIQSVNTSEFGLPSPVQTFGPGVTCPAGEIAPAFLAFFHAPADIIPP